MNIRFYYKYLSSRVASKWLILAVDVLLVIFSMFLASLLQIGLSALVFEAMRCGLPIISTRIAGIPEMIVEGISGYLVDVDEQQLSELFEKILIDRPDFVKMGKKSRIIYEEKFSQKAMILSYAKLWQKA